MASAIRQKVPEPAVCIGIDSHGHNQVWPASRVGMREQEFQFRAKLIHPPGANTLYAHVASERHTFVPATASRPPQREQQQPQPAPMMAEQQQPYHFQPASQYYCQPPSNYSGHLSSSLNRVVGIARSRANSLPVSSNSSMPQQVAHNGRQSLADMRHEQVRSQQSLHGRRSGSGNSVDSDCSDLEDVQQYQHQPQQQQQRSGRMSSNLPNCMNNLNVIEEEDDDSTVPQINRCDSLNSSRPAQPPMHRQPQPRPLGQICQTETNMAPKNYTPQEGIHFVRGDPHSERLAEFVASMVFIIFWHGSDEFVDMLELVDGSYSEQRQQQQRRCPSEKFAFKASAEFTAYTKYLLETMQISCSTALLSLFYLHRLRPRVKHLFVPGTFVSQQRQQQAPAAKCNSNGQPSQHQYRRDPKLEYRLFTVALVLSNKYLDDNSYTNKAWSDVTGLDLRKLNIMEQEFMKYIEYRLVVRENEYSVWVHWLESLIHAVLNGGGAGETISSSSATVAATATATHFHANRTESRRRASIASVTHHQHRQQLRYSQSTTDMDVCAQENQPKPSPVTPRLGGALRHQQVNSLPTPTSSIGTASSSQGSSSGGSRRRSSLETEGGSMYSYPMTGGSSSMSAEPLPTPNRSVDFNNSFNNYNSDSVSSSSPLYPASTKSRDAACSYSARTWSQPPPATPTDNRYQSASVVYPLYNSGWPARQHYQPPQQQRPAVRTHHHHLHQHSLQHTQLPAVRQALPRASQ